jgi:hypothetical protein
MNFKIRKSDLKALSKMAEDMPIIMQNTLKKRLFEKDGRPMVESIPTEIVINHKRRMKKALKEFGPAGVMAYLKAVGNYVQGAGKENTPDND